MKMAIQFAAGAAVVAIVAFLMRTPAERRIQRDSWTVMGTVAGLAFRGDFPGHDATRTRVQKIYERLDALLSAWDPDSELSRISRDGVSNWTERASAEVAECYRTAFELAERSRGAFNPLIGAKMRELGFSQGRHFADFDLGAIAKGFAVDVAWRDMMGEKPVPDALIDLGGNLRVVSGNWRTGVRNPFGEGYAATIVLTNGEAVATSGNYERFVEKNGIRYSHILDGRTGEPVAGTAGVTVVAPSAMIADGLSTTLFVLGPEKGARFLGKWHPGAQALWIPDTPESPCILATPEMAARLLEPACPVRIVRDNPPKM